MRPPAPSALPRALAVLAMLAAGGCATAPRDPAPPAPEAGTSLDATLLFGGLRDARALGTDAFGAVWVAEAQAVARWAPSDSLRGAPGDLGRARPDSLRRFSGTGTLAFVDLRALDAGSGRVVLVADAAGRIVRLGPTGLVLDALGTGEAVRSGGFETGRVGGGRVGEGDADGAFEPVGVRAGPDGGPVALDRATRALRRWDAERRPLPKDAGQDGDGLAAPRALERVGETFFVLDDAPGGLAVVAFDRFGTRARAWAVPPGAVSLGAIAPGNDNARLVVVYPDALRLHRPDGAPGVSLRVRLPAALRAVTTRGDALLLLTAEAVYTAPRPR